MFNPVTYFEGLTDSLKLTKAEGYRFVKVSGLTAFEGIIESRKKAKNFVAINDSENGAIIKGGGGGYFNRKPYTIFIASAAKYGDMDQRAVLLDQHRQIFNSFNTKIIKDRSDGTNNLLLFDSARLPYYEIPGFFANGCVGLYFIIFVDNPVNLEYVDEDWNG